MTGFSFPAAYPLQRLLTVLSLGLWIVSIILLWINGISPIGVVWAVYWPAIFVIQYVTITTPWRVASLENIWFMFLIGMSIVPAITFIAQYALYTFVNIGSFKAILISDALLGDTDLMAPVVAPITEEILKVVPLLIVLSWGMQGIWRRMIGPLDCALLAGACGAGFAFFEHLLLIGTNYWALLGPDRVAIVASPQIGPILLFPEMIASQYYGVPMVTAGHAISAAFVGLTIGFGLYYRKKIKLLWPFIPAFGLVWAIWDHFLWNYYSPNPYQPWLQILPALDLYGELLPYVFLALLIYACYIAHRTQAWYIQQDPDARKSMDGKKVLASLSNPKEILRRIFAFFIFWRLRLMTAFALRYSRQEPAEKVEPWIPWLDKLRYIMLSIQDMVTD